MFTDTIKLPNRAAVIIRPIQPQDIAAIVEMHDRLSEESLYYRYLRFIKPGFELIHQLYQPEAGGGLVAVLNTPQQPVIGVATYHITDKTPPSMMAEAAFLVEDNFQGQGLGRALLERLVRYAARRGVQTLTFYIHATNKGMLRLIQGSGYPFEEKVNFDLREIHMRLEPQFTGFRRWAGSLVAAAQSAGLSLTNRSVG